MKFLRTGKKHWSQLQRWFVFGAVLLALVGSAASVVVSWPEPHVGLAANTTYPAQLRHDYSDVVKSMHDFERRQHQSGTQVVSATALSQQLSLVQLDAASGHFSAATADIKALRASLANWNLELNGAAAKPTVAASVPVPGVAVGGINVPILLYHYPPPNFDQQLDHLQQAGYTTIDLDQVEAALHGGPLPAKPVVITFDDGFAAQTSAFQALVKRSMKATFYIIDAGEASKWCIGAGRRYNDPLQPPSGCGDAYLTWDQVREIDHNSLMTIAGHTINHRNLATLNAADQRLEIITGKQQLEAQIGHSIRHFAYPYGAYNATSIALAREAGYTTAVTTIDGTFQPTGSDFTLLRVRDAMVLR